MRAITAETLGLRSNEVLMSDLSDRLSELSALARQPISIPNFPPPATSVLAAAAEANYASEFHRRLVDWINRFDKELDTEHEVGVRLVSFGQSVVFHLKDLTFWNPSLLSFRGVTDDGQPVELIQHVSQISVLLTKLPRKNPDEPRRPLGFHAQNNF